MPRLVPLVAGLTLAAAITYKFKTDLLNDQGNIKNRVEDVKTTLGKAVIEPGKATGYTTSSSYLSDSQKYVSNRLVPSVKNTWNEQIMNAAQSLVKVDIGSKMQKLWNEQVINNIKEFTANKKND